MLEIHEYLARCFRTLLITNASRLVALCFSPSVFGGHPFSSHKISDWEDVHEPGFLVVWHWPFSIAENMISAD